MWGAHGVQPTLNDLGNVLVHKANNLFHLANGRNQGNHGNLEDDVSPHDRRAFFDPVVNLLCHVPVLGERVIHAHRKHAKNAQAQDVKEGLNVNHLPESFLYQFFVYHCVGGVANHLVI